MKKLHLGKILLLLTLPYLLWAGSVKASLDRPLIYKGDSATLVIEAQGDDIHFPKIEEITGYPVLSRAQSQSITSINGHTTKTLQQSYTFAPTKNIAIPAYDVTVDGKTLTTKPLTLQVTTPQATGKNDPVQLEMRLEKKSLYVGEPVRLDLIFKKTPTSKFAKIELSEPELKGFWAKKLPDSAPTSDKGYIIQRYSYLLFPQQEGNFTIPATFARLGVAQQSRRHSSMFNDPFFDDPFFSAFGNRIKWQKLFSNSLSMQVKALPDNLDIFGDFHIKATADKEKVAANKPVNLTLEITGEGNLDDIKKFTLDIPQAVVYADEPTLTARVENGTYRGTFLQKIAIVADSNYTIPAISFSYFDKKSQSKKNISTDPITITVTGGSTHTPQLLETKTPTSTLNTTAPSTQNTPQPPSNPAPNYEKYLYLLAGIMIGALLAYLGMKRPWENRSKSAKKAPSIIKQIQKTKDDKALFELLLPYANSHPALKEILKKLEKNIYEKGSEMIDQEDILEIFEE